MKQSNCRGISLLEIMVVMAIITILCLITIPALSAFRNEQALKNTTDDLVSLLNEARSDTQASLNSTNYSVYIQSNQATYFVGSTYTNGLSTNKQITFNTAVTIPSSGGITLNGGGSIVTFNRLAGDTGEYGTIVIQLVSDATHSKTITINQTGIVSTN
jgi:prepilin-type N-terminal cleavage/methylation domain-containing protein